MLLPDGAFTVLLLLFSGVSAADVPPPTNVDVSCQNVKVKVSWKYGNQQPQTRFRVNIASSSGHFERYTTEHQVDLSPFVWQSEDHYMDHHYVSVTAIQGGNESEPVKSQTFSFNDLKTVHIKCELDFPPVDVNVKDSGATVSFMNPLHFYSEVQQADKLEGAHFSFRVTYNGTEGDCDCTVKEEICKCGIVFIGAEKCVTLNGSLVRGTDFGEVIFKGTDRICGDEETEVDVIVLALVLSAVVLVIIVVAILIYRVRAWTMKPEPLPKPLEPPRRVQDLLYDVVRPMEFHSVKVSTVNSKEEKNTPTKRLLDSSAGSDLQSPVDAYTDGHLLESSSQEGHRTDNDSADDSVKTECVSMDFDEGEEEEGRFRAPYDRQHAFEVDIGDGEMVTGYSERDHLCGHARHLSESSSSQEGHMTDDDSADDLAKRECVSMHLEEEEEGRLLPAHYDRRHAIEMDIGDGEMVTGYSERDLLCGQARHLSESSSSQEGHRTDHDPADDSVKTECVSMDLEEGEAEEEGKEEEEEEEEEGGLPAHYIRRHAFEVDIGDGEMVTGYSER